MKGIPMNPLVKRTCLMAGGILLILTFCILALLIQHRSSRNASAAYTAFIYQDGSLLQSIPLNQITETCRFTVNAVHGGCNIIEVSPDGIAIAEADCPDQICVRQGRITDSLLPITCLPHRLVIELRPSTPAASASAPDAVAY